MSQITKKIADTDDEAGQGGDGFLYMNQLSFYVMSNEDPESDLYRCVGLRFQINIPKDAIIDSAILYTRNNMDDRMRCNIFAHAIDQSENFVDNPHVWETAFRPRTTNFVEWSEDWLDPDYNPSPDIKDVIQEIISRPGWVANNYLTLLLIALVEPMEMAEIFSLFWMPDYAPYVVIDYHVPIGAPVYHPNKKAFSGYHCFMEQYIKNKEAGVNAYKLPDGTLW